MVLPSRLERRANERRIAENVDGLADIVRLGELARQLELIKSLPEGNVAEEMIKERLWKMIHIELDFLRDKNS